MIDTLPLEGLEAPERRQEPAGRPKPTRSIPVDEWPLDRWFGARVRLLRMEGVYRGRVERVHLDTYKLGRVKDGMSLSADGLERIARACLKAAEMLRDEADETPRRAT